MLRRAIGRAFILIVLAVCGSFDSGFSQGTLNARQVESSRADLEMMLARFEETANSSAYSSSLRAQARQEAALIRRRLEEGDFLVGDQIALNVEGEMALSGGFVVQTGPAIILPQIGTISLRGVLRSELEDHLRRELGRYIRNPVLQARSSIRILVTGAVVNPGYKVVPTNLVFTELLTAAGGPTSDALLERIRIERSDRVIWDGEALQQGIVEGRTIDQLSVQAGDHVIVPARSETAGFGQTAVRVLTAAGPVIFVVVAIIQAF